MSESKTLYTMAEIKESVKNLMYKSQNELDEKLNQNFDQQIEKNPELMLDIKTYENLCSQLINLESKYQESSYNRTRIDSKRLKYWAQANYKDQFNEVSKKIREQFNSILNHLSAMRNPNKALEFLETCGITLPERVKPVISINVDPEFIKSILPKQNLLTDGDEKEGE